MSFISNLFKDPAEPLQNFQPAGINAGGLSSTFDGGRYNFSVSPERAAAVGGVASTFGSQAGEIAGLRPKVAPGFSDLRAARLGEIENARTAAVGNLRDNLARRRVLGSSFGADAVARTEAEFADKKSRAAAETFLQEMEATTNLINQEFTARRGAFQTGLDELNLEANLAAGLAGKATETLGKNAQIEAQLLAEQQSGFGKMIGKLIPAAGAFLGGG
jgi:hypothetical protein